MGHFAHATGFKAPSWCWVALGPMVKPGRSLATYAFQDLPCSSKQFRSAAREDPEPHLLEFYFETPTQKPSSWWLQKSIWQLFWAANWTFGWLQWPCDFNIRTQCCIVMSVGLPSYMSSVEHEDWWFHGKVCLSLHSWLLLPFLSHVLYCKFCIAVNLPWHTVQTYLHQLRLTKGDVLNNWGSICHPATGRVLRRVQKRRLTFGLDPWAFGSFLKWGIRKNFGS